ncbi:hypothetical protein FALBO_9871 [Fusarium albosuccineum]|uniref:Alcohol dehydrogenase-like N-terminal domain-containing protein n=1 Tax=Fusarium albosuccineum TaxID=1237068 RepID=A0A8H4PAB3_9HYPO|nr:hypothetical protein FALBO_9871 [Fusarium albosuccineum]
MWEARVRVSDEGDVTVSLHDVPIPKPQKGQVLIAVVVSGTNPKDWKLPASMEIAQGTNSGDDMAGVVEAVGEGVLDFKTGDRVAAFHQILTPHGSFAEYALAWEKSTFHLPQDITFEEGATIPLAAATAAVALFRLRPRHIGKSLAMLEKQGNVRNITLL